MLSNQVLVLEHDTLHMEGVGYPAPVDMLRGSVCRFRELSPVANILQKCTGPFVLSFCIHLLNFYVIMIAGYLYISRLF